MQHNKRLPFYLVLALGLGCGPRSADTMPPEAETDDDDEIETAEASQPQGPLAPAPDVLRANQTDIDALAALEGKVETEIEAYIQLIDGVQQTLDDLSRMAESAKMSTEKLNATIDVAIDDGNYREAKKFAKADRDAAKEQLQKLHDQARDLAKVPSAVQDSIVRLETKRAQGEELLLSIEGRSDAVASTPLDTLHPDLAAQVNEARQAFAALDGTVTASLGILNEALMRSRATAEALGVDITGPSKPQADVSQAPGVRAPASTTTPQP